MSAQPAAYVIECLFKKPCITRFAFPNDFNAPTELLQRPNIAFVASDVRCQLWPPIVATRFRLRGQFAIRMLVPETTVNENCQLVLGQHNIRLPWKVAAMQSETEASTVKGAAHNQFRLSLRRPDARHERAALGINILEARLRHSAAQST